MWIKRSPGYCRLEKAIRQQELREEKQEAIYRKRDEEAYARLTREFNERNHREN